MFDLIIGYNTLTPTLIDFLSSQDKSIILLSDKEPSCDVLKKHKNLHYKNIDIEDYTLVFQEASKHMISNIFVYTDSDMQNILLADTLSSLSDVTIIFNFNNIKNLTSNEYKSIFLNEIFYNSLQQEVEKCC